MKNFRLPKYWLLSWLLILSTVMLFGQQKSIPNGYYNGTENLSGATLKTALYNIIKGHTDLGYDGLYNAYKTTDNLVIGGTSYVYDMYSVKADGTATYYYSHSSGDRCGSYNSEGDCYNREHSFPQSWFGSGTPKSDAFQVYPTDGYVNGHRSNYPFGEVTSPTWTSSNGSKLGSCSYPGYTGTVFEPIDEYKGDFARTYFYMATRYENVIAGWPGSAMTNGTSYPCFTQWALAMLIEWSNQDPVSTKEINRNEAVYLLQHNRNPFIDHPEFVAQIWGGNSPSVISNIANQPTAPKTTDAVSVSATVTDSDGISSVTIKWGTVSGSLNNSLLMTTSGNTIYSTVNNIPAQNAGVIVYYKIEVTDSQNSVISSTIKSYTVLQADITAPVLNFNILNQATNIGINQQIVLSSNEPLFTNSAGTINSTYLQSNIHCKVGSVIGNDISFQASIDNAKKQITLTFSTPLNYKTTYYVEVPATLFEDAAGNETSKITLLYTTEAAPDTESPILAIAPQDNATDVELNTPIKISSNESLLSASGQPIDQTYLKSVISLKLTDSNGANLSYNATISNDNKVITILPDVTFTYETTYFVKLNIHSFADLSGNLTTPVQSTFTTKSMVDTKAPIFTPGYPKTIDINFNSFGLVVSVDEPAKVFYQMKLKTEAAPSLPQLLESVFIDVSQSYNTDTIFFNGLSENTAYTVYLLTQDKQPAPNTASFILKQNFTTLGIAPAIETNPSNVLTCKGNDALFVAKATGTEPLSYQWYFNENPIAIAIDDTLLLPLLSENQKGLYYCKVSNNWGFDITQEAELDLIADVHAGNDNQKTIKDTVTALNLTDLLLNNPTVNGIWVDLDNSGALSGTLFNPSLSGIGTFRVVYKVSNSCMTDSSIFKIIIEGTSPRITTEPENYTACANEQAMFIVNAAGTEPIAYEWFINDYPIANSGNDTLILNQVNNSYAGNYTCSLTNEWGTITSNPAVLDIYDEISAGADNEANIKNTALEVNLFDLLLGQPTPNGEWTDVDQSGALNGTIFNANQAGVGIYRFNYSVVNACMADESTITITVEWPDAVNEADEMGISIYPNPCQGILNLLSSSQLSNVSFQVFSPDGKMLIQGSVVILEGTLPIDLSDLGKGVYFIKIQAHSNQVIKKLVIE